MVKRAVIIGINYEATEDLRLHGCVKDAIAMHNLLIDAYGYDKSNITVLRDDGFPGSLEPNRENILRELSSVISKSGNDDEVWIHYSGHGSYVKDKDGRSDEYDGYDEMIIPCDVKPILDDELKGLLAGSRSLVHITLDCCHSGTGWDLPYLFRQTERGIVRYVVGAGLENKRIYMLSGARDEQTAADAYNAEQVEPMGAFTEAFIECMRFHNHNVGMFQLHREVNLYLREKGFTQVCEFTSSNANPRTVKITRAGVSDDGGKVLTAGTVRNNMRMMNFGK